VRPCHDHTGARVVEHVGDLGAAEAVVDAGDDQAGLAKAVGDLESGYGVERHHCHAVVRLAPEGQEHVGGAVGAAVQRIEVEDAPLEDHCRLGWFSRRMAGEDVRVSHELMLEARPKSRRRIFGAHAAHFLPRFARGPQWYRCSLTQFSNALAPLLVVRWGPRGAATGGCPWIAESLGE